MSAIKHVSVGAGCHAAWVPPRSCILHADLDSFYASVEQRDDPSLRSRPVVVGAGVVLAASYEAKVYGVRTAMGGDVARRLCPDVIVVPPRFEAYTTASRAVFAVFEDTTPLVEGISIDEAFLDVGGLAKVSGDPMAIAAGLRARVRDEVGLAITVGVARTKFLAKVASRVAKPDGLLHVDPDDELAFLHPLPVDHLWGVGKKTAAKLNERGVRTVGDVAGLDPRALVAMLGPAAGRALHALANARDPRPVEIGRRRRSIGSQRAMGLSRYRRAEIDPTLTGIVERVAGRLRAANRQCRTVVLRLRFGDYARATRSHTLLAPSDNTEVLLAALRRLLRDVAGLIDERGLTMIGVSLAGLEDADVVQLELPFRSARLSALDRAGDEVRTRYGAAALTRAVLLGRDQGWSVPQLPD